MAKRATALLFLVLAQFCWSQDSSPGEGPVILGSPQAEYGKLVPGDFKGKVIAIDCLPFSFEESPEGYFRYWAYRTDDTGFGWIEDEPLIVVSKVPASIVEADGRIRVLTTLVRVEQDILYDQETGAPRSFQVPVFEMVGPVR